MLCLEKRSVSDHESSVDVVVTDVDRHGSTAFDVREREDSNVVKEVLGVDSSEARNQSFGARRKIEMLGSSRRSVDSELLEVDLSERRFVYNPSDDRFLEVGDLI